MQFDPALAEARQDALHLEHGTVVHLPDSDLEFRQGACRFVRRGTHLADAAEHDVQAICSTHSVFQRFCEPRRPVQVFDMKATPMNCTDHLLPLTPRHEIVAADRTAGAGAQPQAPSPASAGPDARVRALLSVGGASTIGRSPVPTPGR